MYHVQLSRRDRQQGENYVTPGQRAARAVTRARILLLADEHYGDEEIMEVLARLYPSSGAKKWLCLQTFLPHPEFLAGRSLRSIPQK